MPDSAAWHPDPLGRFHYRYWDGAEWTEHVSTNGVVEADQPQRRAQSDVWVPPSSWIDVVLLDERYPVQPELISTLQRVLLNGEWILTVQKTADLWFDQRSRIPSGEPWVAVTSARVLLLAERGMRASRFDLTREWSTAECRNPTFGLLYGAGPTWEVALTVPDHGQRRAMSIYCFEDRLRSEVVCAAISDSGDALRRGSPIPWPHLRWSSGQSSSLATGAEIRVVSSADVQTALRGRPERCVLLVSEQQAGRAEFDRSTPCVTQMNAAIACGYEVTGREMFGAPPHHGWMGPGSRTARIKLRRVEADRPPNAAHVLRPASSGYAAPTAAAVPDRDESGGQFRLDEQGRPDRGADPTASYVGRYQKCFDHLKETRAYLDDAGLLAAVNAQSLTLVDIERLAERLGNTLEAFGQAVASASRSATQQGEICSIWWAYGGAQRDGSVRWPNWRLTHDGQITGPGSPSNIYRSNVEPMLTPAEIGVTLMDEEPSGDAVLTWRSSHDEAVERLRRASVDDGRFVMRALRALRFVLEQMPAPTSG